MITQIVDALASATELKVYPFYTENLEECIVYEWTPQADDGSKAQGRLTVRIKAESMAYIEALVPMVKDAILCVADEKKYGAYIKQNGGGMLKDVDTGFIDYILYFDFIYRSGGF